MPCHRSRASAQSISAGNAANAAPGVANSRVATGKARAGCPERGGRVFFSWLRKCHAHLAQQVKSLGLTCDTNLGQPCAEPSKAEQRLAGASIVAVAVGLPILLAGGWPLTLLFGGAS